MARLRVPRGALERQRLELRGPDLRYLRSVLRLSRGARLELFDGEGRAFVAEIVSVGPSAAELELVREVPVSRESPLSLTLAVAISKGAKLDWVMEKATEIGVSRIVPFTSARTIPAREDFGTRVERWRRIASAASAQSGRTSAPVVSDAAPFHEMLELSADHDLALFFFEGGGRGLGELRADRVRRVLVVTGPEGGFSRQETAAAEERRFAIVTLGPRILRAETAAIAAVTLCQFLWGDLH